MSAPHVGYVLKMYPRLSETFIVNEILELERQGARVSIFSLRSPREGRFHEKLARVRADVEYLPSPTTHELLELVARHAEELGPLRHHLGRKLWDVIESGDLRRLKLLGQAVALHLLLRQSDVGHLHAHFATSSTAVTALASELSGVPFSFTAHAKDIYLAAHDYGLLSERIRRARFVVTVCDANRRHLETFDAGETPIHRIYNGLDLDEFSPEPRTAGNPPQILGVGRLVPKKGFDTLIQACRILVDRDVAFRCRIVGTGPEREALATLIAAHDLGAVVDLLGSLPNERVRSLIASADVMALPCRVAEDGNRDALPTVLLEALALETPVVSTPVTGIPEIVGRDEAGSIVPSDRPVQLADALETLLRDPARRVALGRTGRERACRLFDARPNVARLLDLYRTSSNGESPAPPSETKSPNDRQVLHAARLR